MARYIDADALIKKIFPLGMFDNGNYAVNARAVKKAIDSIPTADVAPKSEFAREIFAEIENARERWETVYSRDHFSYGGDAYGYSQIDVDHTIYELKKKYIGEQNK